MSTRHWTARVGVAIAAAALVVPLASSVPSAAVNGFQIDLEPNRFDVPKGAGVTFTARAEPVEEYTIELQISSCRAPSWRTIETNLSNSADGEASFFQHVGTAGSVCFRALMRDPGSDELLATSTTIRIETDRIASAMTVTWPSGDVVRGSAVIQARVSPAAAHRIVTAYTTLGEGEWVAVGTGVTDSQGRVSIMPTRVAGAKAATYRLVVAQDDDYESAVSRTRYYSVGKRWVTESTTLPATAGPGDRIRTVLAGPLFRRGAYSARVQTWDEDEDAWWNVTSIPKASATGTSTPVKLETDGLDGRSGMLRLVLVKAGTSTIVWWGEEMDFDYTP